MACLPGLPSPSSIPDGEADPAGKVRCTSGWAEWQEEEEEEEERTPAEKVRGTR